MKSFSELFRACKVEISDDSAITDFEPIEIALTVMPTSIDFVTGMVTCQVLLDYKLEATETPGQLRQTFYDVELDLPIQAIELVHS